MLTDLIILSFVLLIYIFKLKSFFKQLELRRKREREAWERKRRDECSKLSRLYTRDLAYVTKLLISDEEIQRLIDDGITPEELTERMDKIIAQKDGVYLGGHWYGDNSSTVKLAREYRDKHVYVIGKSGYGKTFLLKEMIRQDIQADRGVGVIAPEQEMITEEILPYIEDHRACDVIYFNPADTDAPVVFNPLHLDEDEDIDLRVDETFTILQRLFGEGGPRMDEILRHTLYALMERPNSTLLDVEPLLDPYDDTFRKEIIKESEDELTKKFFRSTYPNFPNDAHLPITNRIGKLIRLKVIRNCLCQPGKSLDFRKAMDQGKIMLFNLSDGILGQTASELLGQLIVSKFQIATMSRADTSQAERKPYYLYIDEFQHFTPLVASSYEKILSRARKYKLCLTIAHQQTGQLPLELLREILGNVSTLISFQLSQSDAQRLFKEFINIQLEPDYLQNLGVGQAYCRMGRYSFGMSTVKADIRPDYDRAKQIIEESRKRYGTKVAGPKTTAGVSATEMAELEEKILGRLDTSKVF